MYCILFWFLVLAQASQLASAFTFHGQPVFTHRSLKTASSLFMMEPIFTPKTDTPFNFGPSAARDEILYTAERPGNPIISDDTKASAETVNEWIDFIKEKGIKHVLVLLDDNEFDTYEDPGLLELYKAGGLEYHHTPLGAEGAYENTVKILKQVEADGEKAVTHCTGGTGRAGRVAAAWLANRYELSPEEATKEAVDAAIEGGVHRLGNVEKLSKWMNV